MCVILFHFTIRIFVLATLLEVWNFSYNNLLFFILFYFIYLFVFEFLIVMKKLNDGKIVGILSLRFRIIFIHALCEMCTPIQNAICLSISLLTWENAQRMNVTSHKIADCKYCIKNIICYSNLHSEIWKEEERKCSEDSRGKNIFFAPRGM